jgi:hypothetical protein
MRQTLCYLDTPRACVDLIDRLNAEYRREFGRRLTVDMTLTVGSHRDFPSRRDGTPRDEYSITLHADPVTQAPEITWLISNTQIPAA